MLWRNNIVFTGTRGEMNDTFIIVINLLVLGLPYLQRSQGIGKQCS